MKRFLDLTISLLILVIFLPFLLFLMFLIRLYLGSPVFFKQKRPGLKGEPFLIYKFRTMSNKRDKSGNLLPDEQRLTSFGRFLRSTSLDELPELINVVKGEMSLVGPRPLLMEYINLYTSEQARRHDVMPGITGWAQVNGRNAITWEEKFKLDVWYVENKSIWLDIKILWMTLLKVIKKEGISQNGHATVKYFMGNIENESKPPHLKVKK